MKIENEEALDDFIICHKCQTLHHEIPLRDGAMAYCSACGTMMYRYDSRLIDRGLALSITALIFFFVANFFPIVKIEILGHAQFITIPKTFFSLFEHGFYIVGIFCSFLIFIFPLGVFLLYLWIFTLLKIQRGERLTRRLLVLLSRSIPWSMSDIFLLSILVSLVKLIGYAQIEIGTAFWALVLFVAVDLYITKMIRISEIWMLHKRLFFPQGRGC